MTFSSLESACGSLTVRSGLPLPARLAELVERLSLERLSRREKPEISS